MKGRTKAPPQWLTRIKKKQKHNSTIPDAAGVVVRTDGALVPSESGGSDTTTPMLCDRGDASGSGGGTTDPARTIQSFFVHLKGADLQQQSFMELLCIAPFVGKKSGALLDSTVLHIRDLFTHLPISLKQTLRLGHAAHYQGQLASLMRNIPALSFRSGLRIGAGYSLKSPPTLRQQLKGRHTDCGRSDAPMPSTSGAQRASYQGSWPCARCRWPNCVIPSRRSWHIMLAASWCSGRRH